MLSVCTGVYPRMVIEYAIKAFLFGLNLELEKWMGLIREKKEYVCTGVSVRVSMQQTANNLIEI